MNKNSDLVNYDDEYDFGYTEFFTKDDVVKYAGKQDNDKLEKSMKLMMTFLNNLKMNPEKEFLHWPDRAKKVDELIEKLKAITEE